MKHTKGPWIWSYDKNENIYISPETGGDALIKIEGRLNAVDNSRNKANAHLIAASPELLEACKLAIEALRGTDPEETGRYFDREERALQDAINKAEGGN